ncbi:Putative amidase [Cladobotryum mycophilum]|uniref:amidase n=1 Tax=Cladobotryum mycophilum TaxID=491253 RepID=A0ABR0SZ31_9HYPO
MSHPRQLPTVQAKALVTGTPEFEALRKTLFEEFASKVPPELRLPEELIRNPPTNVTGIPRESGILSPAEVDITEKYDATALAAAIASKELTAVAVATAFAKRAIIAHQLTSCLTEWFMDEAIETARALDEHLATTGETVGPLHGVPVSIKEHMPMAGHWSGFGFFDTRVKETKDSDMLAILRAAGAVFYCKTNQPQAIMHLESCSGYWGRTLNPHNIYLSAGGSSGGEGALVAMRGSVLGVGSDVGGSVRGPAAYSGIFGFKPTSYSVPTRGFLPGGTLTELNVLASAGPMCATLRDMDLFMSVVSAAKPYMNDPRVIPISWTGLNTTPKPGPLKIGIMLNDGFITPQPPVANALKWATSKLEGFPDEFSAKTFTPYRVADAMRSLSLAYGPDGGRAIRAHLDSTGEPALPLTDWLLGFVDGVDLSKEELLQQRDIRNEFRCDFVRHWNSHDIDVLICPAFVGPAAQHDTSFYWNYTAFWNYVDYPAASIPTPIKAGKKGEEKYASSEVLGPQDEKVRGLWENGDFEGAPINLQIVARRYHDNDLFEALARLKKVFDL